MKRVCVLFAEAFFAATIVGCGGGLEVGSPAVPPTTSQTPEFRKAMEETGNKMMRKQQGAKKALAAPKAPVAPVPEVK